MMYVLIVFLPLLAALIAGLFGRAIGDRGSQLITCTAVIISALLSWVALYQIAFQQTTEVVELLTWIDSGDFDVNWMLRIDSLTAVMLVVVNTVSSVVHVYSIGYMAHDPHKPRFMSYLSLFTFAMLMLVTSDNFVQLYFGWEGVGLASYLLIGFWFKKPTANAAAIKAFVVNRVGDFGFALGIMAIYLVFDSVSFDDVFAAASSQVGQTFEFLGYQVDILTTICLLLFIGAMGKSAQIGLHTWLPDAMEGPTPVSALIHAATMVTAGVFMVARCSPIFEYSPDALMVVTVVGASTAFFAATVGLVQNDIKRVIAYSTCSQLGYMFFAIGVGAYPVAIFHLFTHAFFKALLFLGAGSVIHAVSDEQDMRKMGGLWRHIKITYAMMWIGSLALAGVPFFAGYYSKDAIIESAFASGSPFGMYAFWMGVAAAVLTAFYSWRLLFMTFHGEPRASKEVMSHIHESGNVMLIPLYVLAAGAIFAGMGFYGPMVGHGYEAFWGEALFFIPENHIMHDFHDVPGWVIATPLIATALGILVAFNMYIRRTDIPVQLAKTHSALYQFLLNKWYFDELYDFILVRPAKAIGRFLWNFGDGKVIDGLGPDGIAGRVLVLARRASQMQSGYVYHYAFAMLLGVAAFVSYFFFAGGH
ncbi:NADH-quinone oxidoreductase subunit L [Sneathiella sp. CAU 1612]|uniref:NADH-quinone oxidoreductase subunit L n=2 Tax=Sneathiella sedimenti TaxID=2816034 RepID=A0ABS3F980_9PROT|nr:NADH-quinone oxidoreductase subunit L [Sneathiella sedimenti]MBO0335023.1 NADH-quinone oxidoreductase subunit L [Sneathiella sedimenti]